MPWTTDTGLKDDFHFRVDTAVFEINEQLGGNLCLALGGTDLDDNEVLAPIYYTCGPGWESPDGSTAIHYKGKDVFNSNSKIGRLVNRVAEILSPDGAAALGEPTDAKTWVDLVFHIVNETRDWTMGDQSGTTTDRLPTEIWRSETDYRSTSAPQTGTLPTGSKKAAEIRASLKAKSSPIPVEERLAVMAKDSGTFEAFLERALNDPEIAASDDLTELAGDTSDTGFYATHH